MKTRKEEVGARSKKNWFLVCFLPVDADNLTGKEKTVRRIKPVRRDSDPVLTYSYISVAQEGLIPVLISPKTENEETSGDDSLKRRHKNRSSRATFDNLTGKDEQDPNRSIISSEKTEQSAISLPKRSREDNRKIEKTGSSSCRDFDLVTSTATIGSKRFSSKSRRNTNSLPARFGESKQSDCNQKTFKTIENLNMITGLYLLLIGVLIMLIWGRVCAIICTSTWLYLVTRRETVNFVPEKLPEKGRKGSFETSDYKKKVIMDGLMERNHRA